jgi:hypothetical protein
MNGSRQFIACESGLDTPGRSSMLLGHEQFWAVYRVWRCELDRAG